MHAACDVRKTPLPIELVPQAELHCGTIASFHSRLGRDRINAHRDAALALYHTCVFVSRVQYTRHVRDKAQAVAQWHTVNESTNNIGFISENQPTQHSHAEDGQAGTALRRVRLGGQRTGFALE